MEDKFSPVFSNLAYNFHRDENADLYNTMADKILEATDYYKKDSGLVICGDKSEAEVAKNILEKDYDVTIKPLGDSEYDLQYHVMFERKITEKYKDLQFMTNKGTPGTLVGDIGGVAESIDESWTKEDAELYEIEKELYYLRHKYGRWTDEDRAKSDRLYKRKEEIYKKIYKPGYRENLEEWVEDDDEYVECPYCGGYLNLHDNQGDYQVFRCGDCGEWVFLDKDNNFKSESEVESEFLNEANGDDSFRDAQDYYDSLTTPEQQEVIDKLNNEFTNIGFDRVEVEQLIPTRDSESNVFVNCCIQHPDKPIEEYEQSVQDILEKSGAEDIRLTSDELNMPKCKYKVWGYCNIPNMTLSESVITENKDMPIVTESMMDEIIDKYYNTLKRLGDE